MSSNSNSDKLTLKEMYNRAIETRNFEIELFWKRSGYFTVLNGSIAVGFFTLLQKESNFSSLGLAAFGFCVSWIWLLITLGSKYWQVRWEEVSSQLEEKVRDHNHIPLFSSSKKMNNDQVEQNLSTNKDKKPSSWCNKLYEKQVMKKYSVSKGMTCLSILFIAFWFCASTIISLLIIAKTLSLS